MTFPPSTTSTDPIGIYKCYDMMAIFSSLHNDTIITMNINLTVVKYIYDVMGVHGLGY